MNVNITSRNLYTQIMQYRTPDTVDIEQAKSPETERTGSENSINVKISGNANLVYDGLDRLDGELDELLDEFAVKSSQNTDNTESELSALFNKMLAAANAKIQAFLQSVERLREQTEMHKQAMDAMAEYMENRRKAMIIAMRIAAGDNVPLRDRQFLIEQSPGMYMKANLMRMRRENENPRDYDSVLSDDDGRQSVDIAELGARTRIAGTVSLGAVSSGSTAASGSQAPANNN